MNVISVLNYTNSLKQQLTKRFISTQTHFLNNKRIGLGSYSFPNNKKIGLGSYSFPNNKRIGLGSYSLNLSQETSTTNSIVFSLT
jgi:hypothetical protein